MLKDLFDFSLEEIADMLSFDERGGVPPELLDGYQGTAPRCEVGAYRDSWVLLFWFDHDQGPHVRTVMTIEPHGDHIAHVRNYFFTPPIIAQVCEEPIVSRATSYRPIGVGLGYTRPAWAHHKCSLGLDMKVRYEGAPGAGCRARPDWRSVCQCGWHEDRWKYIIIAA